MSGRVGALSRSSTRLLCSIFTLASFIVVAAVVANSVSAQSQTMVASWYGPGFEGATTASGEPFERYGFTAAHKELPFGTKLAVTYNGKSAVVEINDRGPFIEGRDIDLAQGAADYIGLTAAGEGVVGIEYVDASTPVGPYSGAAPPTAVEEPAAEPEAEPVVTQQQSSLDAGGSVGSANVEQYDDEGAAEDQPVAADNQYDAGDQPIQSDPVAAEDQYAADNQYAAEDQYDDVDDQSVQSIPALPDDQQPVAGAQYDNSADNSSVGVSGGGSSQASIPAAGTAQVPPAELITPGSTVEKRIELALAAPPANYSGPVPAEAPVSAEAPIASEAPVAVEAPAVAEAPAASGEIETVYGPTTEAPSVVAGLTTLPDTGGIPLVPAAGVAAALLAIGSIFGVRAIRGR